MGAARSHELMRNEVAFSPVDAVEEAATAAAAAAVDVIIGCVISHG